MNPSLYVESSELLGDKARGTLLDFLLIRGAIEKRSGKDENRDETSGRM